MKKHSLAAKAAAISLSVLLTAGALPSAGADAAERSYKEQEVTAYLYNKDTTATFKCLFYEDMPFEPYVNAGEFFARLFTSDFNVTDNGNGVFTITAPNKLTMVADAEKDTVHFDQYEKFMISEPADADGDGQEGAYIKNQALIVEGDAKAVDLPYGKYQIDITAVDGNLYFPLTTLADMCTSTYLSAVYTGGSIYFYQALEPVYFDQSAAFSMQRTEAEAAYTYRELCFALDHFYGKPRRSEFAQKMVQQGIDALLDDPDNANANAIAANIKVINDQKALRAGLKKLRDERYAAYENVRLWGNEKAKGDDRFVAQLFLCGETAVFVFDDFKDAVVEPFKWSLDYTKEKGAKNFLIDISQNLGGSANVMQYIMAIMTGNGDYYSTSTLTGNRLHATGDVDKNLDGVIDEKDSELSYDFRFALLTTNQSYSCGNFLPCLAQEKGIPIIGQTSGGGTCMLSVPVFPGKLSYTISGSRTFTDSQNNDVEAGAKPVLETVTVDAEGTADYSKLYDIQAVGEFLSKQPDPTKPTEATTTAAKATAGSGAPIGTILLIAAGVTGLLVLITLLISKRRKKSE